MQDNEEIAHFKIGSFAYIPAGAKIYDMGIDAQVLFHSSNKGIYASNNPTNVVILGFTKNRIPMMYKIKPVGKLELIDQYERKYLNLDANSTKHLWVSEQYLYELTKGG